jgi:DNA polymerase-3 subunit epsilon
MLSDSFVVLDFETTGLSPKNGDRITEVAAVRVRRDRVVDTFESLVNCGVSIPRHLQEWNGITQRMVDSAPPAKRVISELLNFIGNDHIVAHNANFDQRVFDNECRLTRHSHGCADFICSMLVARRVYPKFRSHALQALVSRFRLSVAGDAHRAGPDATITANLLMKMARDLRARHGKIEVNAALLRMIMRMPIASAEERLHAL